MFKERERSESIMYFGTPSGIANAGRIHCGNTVELHDTLGDYNICVKVTDNSTISAYKGEVVSVDVVSEDPNVPECQMPIGKEVFFTEQHVFVCNQS